MKNGKLKASQSKGLPIRFGSLLQYCLSACLMSVGAITPTFAVVSSVTNKISKPTTTVNLKADASQRYFQAHELVVKIKPSHVAKKVTGTPKLDADASLSAAIPGYSELKSRHRIKKARRLLKDEPTSIPGDENEAVRVEKIKKKFSARTARAKKSTVTPALDEIYVLSVDPASGNIEQLARDLVGDSSIAYAVPNLRYRTQFIPSDPLYSQQWAHTNASAPAAWDIERGNASITVAIIDVGVDFGHEDLSASMRSPCATGCAPGTGYDFVNIDTTAYKSYGYTLPVGEDLTTEDAIPMDFNGHGTHCAGIVAATGNNGKGISGIAPGVKIMPVRAGFAMLAGTDEYGLLEADDIASGIQYAADNGADIISMSFGFGGWADPVISDAIDYAASLGAVLVAAAGNDGTALITYPAGFSNVIAVGAISENGMKTYYSNYGLWVDIAAPGGSSVVGNQILSTVPVSGGALSSPSGYRAISGTSMACPYVAGVAALILSRNPTYSVEQVTQVLLRSVDNLSETTDYLGTGKVNAFKAVSSTHVAGMVSVTYPWFFMDVRGTPNISIEGTAQVSGGTYQLSWGQGMYPTSWNLLGSGSANIVDGVLGSWSMAGLSTGYYNIRISVQVGTQTLWTNSVFFLDKNLRANWPISVRSGPWGGLQFGNGSTLYDIDNNGSLEVFTKSNQEVFAHRGDGTLLPGWPAATGTINQLGTSATTEGPAIGDIDNDGSVDIVTALGHRIYAWSTTGVSKPGFPIVLGDPSIRNNSHRPLQLVDLDNNGTLELVLKSISFDNIETDRIEVFTSTGARFQNWPYTFPANYAWSGGFSPYAASSFVDTDQDGFKEVIGLGINHTNSAVGLFIWNYDGTLRNGYPIQIPGTATYIGRTGVSAIVADIDKDGEVEIGFNPSEEMGRASFGYIKLDGSYKTGWPINTVYPSVCNATVADLDKNGSLETILSYGRLESGNSTLVIGTNGAIWPGFPKSVPYQSMVQAVVSDLDNDGNLDILVGDTKGTLYAWNKNGNGIADFPKTTSDWGLYMSSTPSVGDIDGDGKSELVASTQNGMVYSWDLDGAKIPGSSDWPQAFQNPRLNMLSDIPVGSGSSVALLGPWVKGATHAKEVGPNRALVVMVYGEGSTNISAASVKYGGKTLIKIAEKSFLAGVYSYTGAFILKDADITAATSNSIAITWTNAPTTGFDIVSAFVKNVGQTNSFSSTATGSTTGATVTTASLANSNGDMVMLAATAANNGTYTINNGFIRGIAETSASFGDITSAYKVATGANETPSVTMSGNQRQTMVGFVLKKAGTAPVQYTLTASAGANGSISPSGSVSVTSGSSQTFTITPNSGFDIDAVIVDGVSQGAITSYTFSNVTTNHSISATFKVQVIGGNVALLGNWVKSNTHAKEAGTKRALVVMVYGEGASNISASSVTYGGQVMTKVIEKSFQAGAFSYTGAFILKESGVAAATSGAISVVWSSAPSTGFEVVSAFLTGVNQTTTVGASASAGLSGATITTPSLATLSGDMVLVAGTAATNASYTLNNGFTRGIAETSASFGDITSAQKSATGSNETPSVTSSTSQRQTLIGIVVKK